MTLRRRLSLWYGTVLVVCVVLAVFPSYDELILDAPQYSHAEQASGWARFHAVLRDVIIDALPFVLIGLVGGWLLTRRALRPLDRMAEMAEKLDEHTLGERLPAEQRDTEVERLAQVFNAMAARLEKAFGRVREFTLHASHELKTPLAIMRGDIETSLRTWQGLDDDQREKLASHIDEIDRLTQIVDGLTFLVKTDAGQSELAAEPVPFEDIVDEMIEDLEILAATSDISVTLTHRATAIVLGDRPRLRQMVLNLADNAIKYNDPGGHVEVALDRSGSEVRLKICNTGPGLDAEHHAQVFDRFYRGPGNGGNVEGSGLGLSIVESIVHAHHGHIEFRSQPGRTEVEVLLPVYPPSKPNDSIVI